MSGHKPWNEINAKMRADAERRTAIEQREQAMPFPVPNGNGMACGSVPKRYWA